LFEITRCERDFETPSSVQIWAVDAQEAATRNLGIDAPEARLRDEQRVWHRSWGRACIAQI
jgi:hypothetical protein